MTRPAKLVQASRPGRRFLLASGAIVAAVMISACGTQQISVPTSRPALHNGAVLFNQRCSGCHTLSYAATHGSAANVRTALYNNGPNFNERCERPAIRVLYAIENGGFSGAIMPQNIVVGQQAIDVAEFVSTYSGRQAPKVPGVAPCVQKAVGSIKAALTAAGVGTGPVSVSIGTTGSTGPTGAKATVVKKAKAKHSAKRKR